MLIGTVVGTAISTVKHASMERQKLLIVQPELADGQTADGDPVVAIDSVGAGIGERVLVTSDGRFARDILKAAATPVRWTVIGIRDELVGDR